jgi:hypothetical protein
MKEYYMLFSYQTIGGMSYRQTAERFNVSHSVIVRLKQRVNQTGSVKERQRTEMLYFSVSIRGRSHQLDSTKTTFIRPVHSLPRPDSARLSATGGNRATTLVSHVTGYESDKAFMGLSANQ